VQASEFVERSARRALVTGASRGLGLEIGLGFARAGYRVALNGRDAAALEAAQARLAAEGIRAEVIVGDLSDGAPGIVAAAAERLGGLDVLVHAAAMRDRRGTADLGAADFARVLDANLTGCYVLAREVLPHLQRSQAGRLIFLTSIAASLSRRGDPAYSAAKGGLAALTRSLAVELGSDSLTVNSIAPGMFLTDVNRPLAAEPATGTFVDMRVPLRRWGRPEEIAPAALFLASEGASYVNGITVTVDGGLSAQM